MSWVRARLDEPCCNVESRFPGEKEVFGLNEYGGEQGSGLNGIEAGFGGSEELIHDFGCCRCGLIYDHQRGDLRSVRMWMMVIDNGYGNPPLKDFFSDLS